MSAEKRLGMGPIPTSPEMYINEKQVDGMSILKKFGWKLVCIRRPQIGGVSTLLKHSHERGIGVLGVDGVLRIHPEIKIRQ
ncbi:MAG: hypothetical protein KZQ88_18070 [Candidatus Thiodiazotropha sp. (ex Dulcina madagascariensis)]|nr:hypothetical protein [Candidatus Thiodiazotropha sp. (ex Epidulcina cf. delphinae)]MCU7924602.1 hypothetical protein [Candidatus Thiodiazotropha sp. (ex Dulcina madagascariensis)]MCU7928306.1 hypothetical protein [Candidatus Thiodiazotropha sp. (ex Dulcina madagascariensis)]